MDVRKPSPATVVITTTPAERQEAQQALVYEKALHLTLKLAKASYTQARVDVAEFVDKARVIAKEADVAWPQT